MHNQKVKQAVLVAERRRNAFLGTQLEVLAPFVKGAKRSLQVALGLEVGPAADGGRDEVAAEGNLGDAFRRDEPISCGICGRLFEHVGAMKSHRKSCTGQVLFNQPGAAVCGAAGSSSDTGLIPMVVDEDEAGSKRALSTPPPQLDSSGAPLTPFDETEVFGALPEGDLDADAISDFAWLEATLQPHQVIGVNWMLRAYRSGINGILADEMGLGKTIQTIAFLGILKKEARLQGPSLVVAPLSVLTSWVNEFKRFAPSLRVVRLHSGDKEERELMRTEVAPTPHPPPPTPPLPLFAQAEQGLLIAEDSRPGAGRSNRARC